MKTLRIEVFNASPSLAQLRFFADGNPQPRIRDLAPAELTDFCQRSLAHYQDGLSLQALGKRCLTGCMVRKAIWTVIAKIPCCTSLAAP